MQGWLLPSLCTVRHAVDSAAGCGLRLVEDRDLSGFLVKPAHSRMGKPARPRMHRLAVRVMRGLPVPWLYWRSTTGSLALSACRQERLVQYHVLLFEKPGTAPDNPPGAPA